MDSTPGRRLYFGGKELSSFNNTFLKTSTDMFEHFIGEFIGTMLLLILGSGVVANVVLNKTKGQQSGWIVITFGWAMGVFIGVFASTNLGGSGHLNPAVTLAMAAFTDFDSSLV